MLAKKSYSIAEMEELLRTKGKQNIDRKLERYGIGFTSDGYGSSRTTIFMPMTARSSAIIV